MSHSAIDITRQQDRPLKGRATIRRRPAPHATHAPMREPERLELTDELRIDLQNRLDEALAGKVSYKTVGDIIAEELGEAYR